MVTILNYYAAGGLMTTDDIFGFYAVTPLREAMPNQRAMLLHRKVLLHSIVRNKC